MARGWDSADTGTPRRLPWKDAEYTRRRREWEEARRPNVRWKSNRQEPEGASAGSLAEAPPHGPAGGFEDRRVVPERERAVGVVEQRVHVEDQLVDVLVGRQVAGGLRRRQLPLEPAPPAAVELRDPVLDRTGLGVDLGGGTGEEA